MREGGGWDEDPLKDPRDKEPADRGQRSSSRRARLVGGQGSAR